MAFLVKSNGANSRLSARSFNAAPIRPNPSLNVEPTLMRAYLQSIWVKVGVGLLLVGATPLVFIAAAALGLWPDPIPNPVGPGLLFYFTFWPAIICIVIEVIRGRIRTVVRPNPVLFGADGALCREIAALREALA